MGHHSDMNDNMTKMFNLESDSDSGSSVHKTAAEALRQIKHLDDNVCQGTGDFVEEFKFCDNIINTWKEKKCDKIYLFVFKNRVIITNRNYEYVTHYEMEDCEVKRMRNCYGYRVGDK